MLKVIPYTKSFITITVHRSVGEELPFPALVLLNSIMQGENMNEQFYYRKMDIGDIESMKVLDTLRDLVLYGADTYGEKKALCSKSEELTYVKLKENSFRIAAFLSGKFEKGARIAILCDPSVAWIEVFMGIICGGMTAVLIPPSMPPEAVWTLMKMTNTKGVVYDNGFADNIQCIKKSVQLDLCMSIEQICRQESQEIERMETIDPDSIAALFFTTGTTGANKCVPLSHKVIMRNAYNGMLGIPSHKEDVCLAILPFFHVFGLIRSVLTFLYEGGTVYLSDTMKTFIADLQWVKPTTLILVPSLAESLCGLANKKGSEVLGGRLRTIITGGSAMKPKTKVEFLKHGIELLQGYGLTEASMIAGNTDTEEHMDSVGKPYPGTEVRLQDGEILIKGDNVFKGYLNPKENACVFENGWYHTGDLGYIDEEGYLYIVGRKKFVIITENGENISPEELEKRVDALEGVEESLVYEDKTDKGKAIIAVDIYAPSLSQQDCEDKVLELNRKMPNSHRIYSIHKVEEPLPRNAGKKVIRKRV